MKADPAHVPLGEVLHLDVARVPVDAVTSYPMVGVLSFGRGLFDREPIVNGGTSYKYFHRLKPDHVVMSQLFGWEGALALSSESFAGKFLSPQFPTFLCDTSRLDRAFLGWMMRRRAFWEELGSRTSGMGDRRRTLTPKALFACEIPLPPLAEQQRVVARIEEVAGKIGDVRALRSLEGEEIGRLLGAAFAGITKSVPRRTMRDVAPLVRRPVRLDPDGSYPELGIRSFGRGTFHKPALSGVEVGSKRIFRIEPNDLLFSNVFAWEGAIAVARTEDRDRFGSHRFITAVPMKGIATSQFLCFFFLADEGLELIRSASPGGAGRNRTLGLAALEGIEVPVPPIEEQEWFDALQAEVASMRRLQAETAAELDALLPAILDRAFKGEL